MEKMSAEDFRKMHQAGLTERSKYNVTPVLYRTFTGVWRGRAQKIVFDSGRECTYCIGLIQLEKQGLISSLRFQEPFLITEKTETEQKQQYIVDYCFYDIRRRKWVAGDVKSEITAKNQTYINKRKEFKKLYPDIIFEEMIL
jgi:hypothetical protein